MTIPLSALMTDEQLDKLLESKTPDEITDMVLKGDITINHARKAMGFLPTPKGDITVAETMNAAL